MLEGNTAILPDELPVPDSGTDRLGLGAFELILRSPVTLPLVCGLKLTWNVTLCPLLRVTGGLMPLNSNPEALAVICEIVTALLPEFVNVSDRVFVVEI